VASPANKKCHKNLGKKSFISPGGGRERGKVGMVRLLDKEGGKKVSFMKRKVRGRGRCVSACLCGGGGGETIPPPPVKILNETQTCKKGTLEGGGYKRVYLRCTGEDICGSLYEREKGGGEGECVILGVEEKRSVGAPCGGC